MFKTLKIQFLIFKLKILNDFYSKLLSSIDLGILTLKSL